MNKQEVGFFVLIVRKFSQESEQMFTHQFMIHEPSDVKLEQCIAVTIQISIFRVG